MIESLDDAYTDKGFSYDFRGEAILQFSRSNVEGIRHINDDLAVPVFKLLRNVLVAE